MSEIELRDQILRHAIQLQRLSAHESAEVEAILKELERELKLLLQSDALSRRDKRAIRALIAEASRIIDPAYARAATTVDTHGLALIVAEKTAAAMTETLGITALAATPERLASLTRDVLIEGSPLSQWWKAQAERLKTEFARHLRLGVIAGETNERIVRRIAGGRVEAGVMDIARRHARTLVHSSVMSAANEARLAVYRKNADVLSGVMWIATLDSITCLRCGAIDQTVWDLDGKPKGNAKFAFTVPPLHANCRCALTPVVRGFSGKDGTRASSEGPVDAGTDFEDFLKRQPASFIDKVLGRKRAEMFRDGKITMRDLISGNGRALTLDELAEVI